LFADEVAVVDQGEVVEFLHDVSQIPCMTHPISQRLLASRLPINRQEISSLQGEQVS